MLPYITKYGLLVAWFVLGLTSYAQYPVFINYSVEDGLPVASIKDIIQDRQGYLWFGTEGGGISKYDGFTFQNYGVSEGLINNTVTQLYIDKDDNLWITTVNGLSKYDGETFENFTVVDDVDHTLRTVFQDSSGFIWVGGNSGLYKMEASG
ncbi:MAG: hypothetical protein IH946_11705, partial [Bacteroidetes bacterium]|nr:hypothetical protein [Bacteroidota bacterium]